MLRPRPRWVPAIALSCGVALGCESRKAESAAAPPAQPRPDACAALPRAAGTRFALEVVATGLVAPVHAAAAPGEADRLFVVEQGGRIRVVRGGRIVEPPFADLRGLVQAGDERGLLGIAIHPEYASNGKVYVHYTDLGGDVRVDELTAPDPGADVADPASRRNLLAIEHSTFANHNGGMLAFGPDGWLYVGVGDGGGGGDPLGNAQDPASPLGKILRVDVAAPATPVPGNPFGNAVYHYGLRNPWRFGFDRRTGDLYVGDVGETGWEEIDFQASAGPGQAPAAGTNWGWNVREGTRCFEPPAGCASAGLAPPVVEYSHAEGIAVVGGFVYRGEVLPDLAATGTYFYGDFGSGFVRTLRMVGGVATERADVTAALGGPFGGLASFAEDGCGELLLVQIGGTIRRLVPAGL